MTVQVEQETCCVEGCNRPRRGKNTPPCNSHYFRMRRTGSYGESAIRPKGLPKAECSVKGCDEDASADEMCKRHYTRVRRHGDPTIVKTPRLRFGVENAAWLPDELVGYYTAHERVGRALGKAAERQCVECGGKAKHWAYDHADENEKTEHGLPYSLDPEHYRPMCVPCHRRFDLGLVPSPAV